MCLKKLLSLVLVIACVTYRILSPVCIAEAEKTSLYSQNFEEGHGLQQTEQQYTDKNGSIYTMSRIEKNGFTNFSGENFGTSMVDDPKDENNTCFLWKRYSSVSYNLTSNDTNCYIYFGQNGINTASYLDTSFKMYLPRQPESNQIQIRMGGACDTSNYSRTVELTFKSTESGGMTLSVRARKGTATINSNGQTDYWRTLTLTSVADLNDDSWNDIRIIDDYNEHKSHLFINGKLVCADMPHGNKNAEGLRALYLISDEDSIPTTAYFDDFSINTIEEADIANAIYDGANACLKDRTFKANPDRFDGYFTNQGDLPASVALDDQTTSFEWHGRKFVNNSGIEQAYYDSAKGSVGSRGDLRITPPADKANAPVEGSWLPYCQVTGYVPKYYSNNAKSDYSNVFTPVIKVGNTVINDKPLSNEVRIIRYLLETTDSKIELGIPNIEGGYWISPSGAVNKSVNLETVLKNAKDKYANDPTDSNKYIWRNIRIKNTDSKQRRLLFGLLYYKNGELIESNSVTPTLSRLKLMTLDAGGEGQWSPNINVNLIPDENQLSTLSVKFLVFDMTNGCLKPLLNSAPSIGLAEGVKGAVNLDGTKLTLSGEGAVETVDNFADTTWSSAAETVKEIDIKGGVTSIGKNTLSGFKNLEIVKIPETVTVIDTNGLPDSDTYTIIGYKNSVAQEFAENNGNNFLLNGLRVLSIGNSHTADYSAFRDIIKRDLKDAGLNTELEMSTIVYGGRKLYTEDTLATNPPHLNAIKNGTYDKYLVNDKWDLIIIQDWHEASRNDSEFTSKLSEVISVIKEKQPDAEIAWVMDWADKSTISDGYGRDLDEVYENITDTASEVNNMAENKPDFIIPMGTAIQNARSSYFGATTNAYGCYVNASDTDYSKDKLHTYSILERDGTHMSLELGRYTAGAAVLYSLVYQYSDILYKENSFNFETALRTVPDSANSSGKAAWKGAFTESIWNIVRESVKNAFDNPLTVTPSEYTDDPAAVIMQTIENSNVTGEAQSVVKAAVMELDIPAGVEIDESEIIIETDKITIPFLYGYTKLNAEIIQN